MNKLLVAALAFAVVWSASPAIAQPNAGKLGVRVSGIPGGAKIEITAEVPGAGGPTVGTAGLDGLLEALVVVGKDGKPHVQTAVHIGDQCVDGTVRISLVQSGADPKTIPPQCRRRIAAGLVWLDSSGLAVDVSKATVVMIETSTLNPDTSTSARKHSKKAKVFLVLVPAAAAGGAVALKGGGSRSTPTTTNNPVTPVSNTPPVTATPPTTTPPAAPPATPPAQPAPPPISAGSGVYLMVVTVTADGNVHRTFVRFDSITSLTITVEGSTITISGGDPWVTVRGTIDSSGRFVANGMGMIAGRNNVPVMADGTLSVVDVLRVGPQAIQGNITMNIAVGGGGSLPGTIDDGKIRYSATGRRQ